MEKIALAKEYVSMIADKYSDNLILVGKQGTGKSFLTTSILKEKGINFTLVTSSITPLELYRTLYNNSSKDSLLVFDDIDGLFENDKTFSLMLAAMGDKRCMWVSSSTLLGTVPPRFDFQGRIIILSNELGLSREIRENAIKSRCLYYDLDFSNEEIISFMREIAQTPRENLTTQQRLEVVDFIEQNTDLATKELSLRTQQRVEEMYLYSREKWRELSLPFLAKDDLMFTLMNSLKEAQTVDEAQVIFTRQTGLSRRTFFRLKKKAFAKVPNFQK